MARAITIKHIRKADAFSNGELAAGEWGLDTTNGVWYYSADGTTVTTALARQPEVIQVACSDATSNLTTGTAKTTFRMPFAMTLTSVRASVNTAPSGSAIIIDVNEAGTTIFSTNPQIAAGAKTSVGGATPGTLSDTSLADDAEITIDIDQIGSVTAGKGLVVTLIGRRT